MIEPRKAETRRKKTSTNKSRVRELTFPYAMRSFLGYLEGTHKAAHTISSYKSDLNSFQTFLEKNTKGSVHASTKALKNIQLSDLEEYHDYLRAQGQKVNSRRRKLLTVRRLMTYLNNRNKLTVDAGKKLPAPYKVERVRKSSTSRIC